MKTRKLFPIKLYFILILLLGCNALLHAGDSIPDATLDSLAEIIHSFPEDVEDDTTARNRLRLLRMTQLLEGFSQIEEYHISSAPFNSTDIKKILIIAKRNVFSGAAFHILRYANDIHNVWGCEVKVLSVSGETETDIKSLIISDSLNLSGVVFVGDIIPAYYHMDSTTTSGMNKLIKWKEDTFPCDLYYMDLNGSWLQSNDGSGRFYSHTGNVRPEIFVGRINTSNFEDNEIQELRIFFDKDHQYWTGKNPLNKERSLSFTYQEWDPLSEFRNEIRHLYGYSANKSDYISGSNFTKDNYIECLENRDYEFIQFACHSSSSTHWIKPDSPYVTLTRNQIALIHKKQLGYNLYCCSGCRWTNLYNTRCLGEVYLYGGENYSKALALVGSTKTGSMYGFHHFYKPLGRGKCIGFALKKWWIDCCKNEHEIREQLFFYGMCLFGDPLVNFNFTNECEDELTVSGIELTNSSYYAQSKITLHNYAVYGNQEVTLNAPIIEITGNFVCDKPAKLETNINDYCACNNNQGSAPARRQNAPAAIETSVSESKEFFCFPNPAREILYIECPSPLSKAHIYNLNGQLVLQTSETQIDVSSLSSGVYIVHAQTSNGQLLTAKFVHL